MGAGWHWRPHRYCQLTSGQLEKCTPGAGQRRFGELNPYHELPPRRRLQMLTTHHHQPETTNLRTHHSRASVTPAKV